ncbi:TBC1 domain member 9, partial [Gonapodya sp. JEL0774]
VIIEKLLPDHFTTSLVGSVIDQSVLETLAVQYMPELIDHLRENLYMDLGMLTYSWLMTLFLTQMPLSAGVRIMDGFFLDGPPFLFWVALAVLKLNEPQLCAAKDEEKASRVLKTFFDSLGRDDFSSPAAGDKGSTKSDDGTGLQLAVSTEFEDLRVVEKKSPPQRTTLDLLFSTAYSSFASVVTHEIIDELRTKSRLTVVHKMDDTSKKSRTRDLQEMFTSFNLQEVTAVYDELSVKPAGAITHGDDRSETDEDIVLDSVARRGCWGIKSPSRFPNRLDISLRSFRTFFAKLSPWKSLEPSLELLQREPSLRRPPHSNTPSAPDNTPLQKTMTMQKLPLADRIYTYLALHRHLLHSTKHRDGGGRISNVLSMSSPPTSPSMKRIGNRAMIVDAEAVLYVLEIILKKGINDRLKFLFDLHDCDSDGHLSEAELNELIDTLQGLFTQTGDETLRRMREAAIGRTHRTAKDLEEEELSRSVGVFLSTALKSGLAGGGGGGKFSLSFNSYLLALFSQSSLVKFFEKVWSVRKVVAGSGFQKVETAVLMEEERG